MASGTGFKQQCPSCEALVPVKDASLVGKKIECPKCKDKFIVAPPPKEKDAAGDSPAAPKAKTAVKPAPAKGTAAPPARPGKADDTKKQPVKAKAPVEDDDDEEEEKGSKKKKKAGTSRFTMGIVLGVVGLLLLGAAAFFILNRDGGPKNLTKGAPPRPNQSPRTPTNVTPDPNVDTKEAKDPKDPLTEPIAKVPAEPSMPTSSAELTNLLPDDSDHVAHIPFRTLFNPGRPLAHALFDGPDALKDDFLKAKLGFSLLAVDDLIRADHYGAAGWSFTVVHSKEIINQDAVKRALGLKAAPAIKKYTHYQVTTSNPWFERLSRFALGVPRQLRALSKQERPFFVHFHSDQTMIFADETPMVAFLKVDKQFKTSGDLTPAPTKPGAEATTPPASVRVEAFSTIKPALKAIMDRQELPGADAKETWFSSATDLTAARLPSQSSRDGGKPLWSPRQVWDVTLLIPDPNPRIEALGVSLVQKDDRTFRLRNELHCPVENDARILEKELAEDVAPEMARFIQRLLGHKVEVPKKDEPPPPIDPKTGVAPPPPPPPVIDPAKAKKDELASRITVKHKDKVVDFLLELRLENNELARLQGIAGLISSGLRAEMEAAAGLFSRHDLALAGKRLPEEGLSEQNVLPGNYPPGAFLRSAPNTQRFLREPKQRISWMAGLLPYLGQRTLYEKINFNDTWRGPSNWMAAGTLVPQFVDPAYPASFYVARPDLPLELAATHFVGIAGVGLDAADYDPADPAVVTKRGVMSYDKGMALDEVRQGHGLGNTILMIQVPPDGLTGPTPWIAGGGSTLRGVPDKNSVAPFVFSSAGKDAKTRRGTYALMADGSVRFIDQNVSDEVFKAMATAKAPMPEDYDPDGVDSKTPLVRPPANGGLKDKSAQGDKR